MSNTGVGSAAQLGATAFVATGNPWVAAGAAALGLLSGNSAQKAQDELLKQKFALTQKQNELMIAETARGVSEINRQRTLAFLETNRSLRHIQRQSGDESANVLNQYAAVDQVGTNVLVAQSEVERQLDENTAMVRLNNEITNENLNNQIVNLTNQGQSSLNNMHTELQQAMPSKFDTVLSLADAAFTVVAAQRKDTKLRTEGATKTTNQSSGLAQILGLGNG